VGKNDYLVILISFVVNYFGQNLFDRLSMKKTLCKFVQFVANNKKNCTFALLQFLIYIESNK